MNDCMKGFHLWDTAYEIEVSSERLCRVCGHFFAADDTEDNATDDVIEWQGGALLNKQVTISQKPAAMGLNKGLIKRR